MLANLIWAPFVGLQSVKEVIPELFQTFALLNMCCCLPNEIEVFVPLLPLHFTCALRQGRLLADLTVGADFRSKARHIASSSSRALTRSLPFQDHHPFKTFTLAKSGGEHSKFK